MRFVHIADTHLGLAAFNKIDPDTGMNLRERLIYDNFLESVEEIIRQKPGALVHAGDLFDRVKPKTRAYTTVLEALDRFREEEIPFVVISGNHSMPKTRYTSSPFEVLKYHAAEVHAAYRYRYERVELEDGVFHLIPNMLHAEDYMGAFNEIEWAKSSANILVTHGLASMLHDWRMKTVAEHELSSTLLSEDFDYIALGHFHDQRQIADNAWYSGSLEYCSYGEISDEKGGLMVDTARGKVLHMDLPKTPMVNLGTLRCESLSQSEIAEKIVHASEKIAGCKDKTMCQLTLTEIRRDDARSLNRRFLFDIRKKMLDFRLRVIPAAESGQVFEGRDLKAVDYVAEFEAFLKKKGLDLSVEKYISGTGREVLKQVVETHREDPDAAS
jgi:exonuclease SbcD